MQFFKDDQTVLFLGDEITGAGRDESNPISLGDGYVAKAVEIYNRLFLDADVHFINNAHDRSTVPDLIVRYFDEVFDVEPDFISIMIGINDVWRKYDSNEPSTVEAFRDHYEYLLKMIKSNLPDTRIMLIEPFLINSDPEKAVWREDLDPKINVVREMASKYANYYLPLDGIFASACTDRYTAQELSEDGVHPTGIGHAIITDAFLKELGII